jgi:hypothetical protein
VNNKLAVVYSSSSIRFDVPISERHKKKQEVFVVMENATPFPNTHQVERSFYGQRKEYPRIRRAARTMTDEVAPIETEGGDSETEAAV